MPSSLTTVTPSPKSRVPSEAFIDQPQKKEPSVVARHDRSIFGIALVHTTAPSAAEPGAELSGHGGASWANGLLASGSDDGTVRLWDSRQSNSVALLSTETAVHSLTWCSGLLAAGTMLLVAAVDPVAGALALLVGLLYVAAYTPLKQKTSLSTLIGAEALCSEACMAVMDFTHPEDPSHGKVMCTHSSPLPCATHVEASMLLSHALFASAISIASILKLENVLS